MTTDTCIAAHKRVLMDKLVQRFKLVDIVAAITKDGESEGFFLHGRGTDDDSDSGLFNGPSICRGLHILWTISDAIKLLELIAEHGVPTKYTLILSREIAQFKFQISVAAGEIPLEVAGQFAAGRQAEIHELLEIK